MGSEDPVEQAQRAVDELDTEDPTLRDDLADVDQTPEEPVEADESSSRCCAAPSSHARPSIPRVCVNGCAAAGRVGGSKREARSPSGYFKSKTTSPIS